MTKKALLLMFVLAAIVGIAFLPSTETEVDASPMGEIYRTYYSDATYTTEIGSVYWSCLGGRTKVGSVSSYTVTESAACPDGNYCVRCTDETGPVDCPGWILEFYGSPQCS